MPAPISRQGLCVRAHCRSHVAAARLLREEGERYTADPAGDEDDAASPVSGVTARL